MSNTFFSFKLSLKQLPGLFVAQSLAIVAVAAILAPGCKTTQANVSQVSGDGRQVALQMSRDSKSLLAARGTSDALEARDALLKRTDLSQAMLTSVAELSLIAGKPDEAAKQARAILKKDFRNADAMKVLVKVALVGNRFEEAILVSNNALNIQSRDADLLCLRGLANYMLGHAIEAREDWKKAMEFNPTHVPAQMNLAALYFQTRYVPQAGAIFDKVLAMQPQNLDAQVGKALVLSAQGQDAEARTLLADLLARNPKSPLVLYNLAALEKERFLNFEVALQYTERYLAASTHERQGVERAIAQREELRHLLAQKASKLSDTELRQMASKSSQAVGHGAEGDIVAGGRQPEGHSTETSSDAATAAPKTAQASKSAPGKGSVGSKQREAAPVAEPMPAEPNKASVLATDDASALEEAIK